MLFVLRWFLNGKCIAFWKHNTVCNCCTCFSYGFRTFVDSIRVTELLFSKVYMFWWKKERKKKAKCFEKVEDAKKILGNRAMCGGIFSMSKKAGLIGTLNEKGSLQHPLINVKWECCSLFKSSHTLRHCFSKRYTLYM